MQKLNLAALSLVALGCTPGAAIAQMGILIDPKPQALPNSCQSYALAYALGTAPGSPFSIATTRQLRTLELELRAKIDELATKRKMSTTSHEIWQAAVLEYTGARYRLNWHAYKDIEGVFRKVEELTSLASADQLFPGLASVLVRTPALLSVEAVGKNTYPSGHIVTALGVGGPPNARSKFLVLNGAVKGVGHSSGASCESIGDEKYSAEAVVLQYPLDFVLKRYSDGYHVIWIEKL